MELVYRLSLGVLCISLLTFITLFGQLPRLRRTPIGWLHRFFRYTVPKWLSIADRRLAGGYLGPALWKCGNYLISEKHPLVMVLYLTLVTGSAFLFVSDGWQYLTLGQQFAVMIVLPLPYISIYLAAYSDPGFVKAANHAAALRLYPYDNVIFFMDKTCPTCQLTKPARSKHCSVCKGCIAKHDHHCIWINNCIGVNNARYFLFFLLSNIILLTTGALLCFNILHKQINEEGVFLGRLRWRERFSVIGLQILESVWIGCVMLLCCMTSLLAITFTMYQMYLIWAGTTTNETMKWADWRDDIKDGNVFMADEEDEKEIEARIKAMADLDSCKTWPKSSRQYLFRIEDGRTEDLPRGVWRRVRLLEELDNIYDLGGWKNLMDALMPGKMA